MKLVLFLAALLAAPAAWAAHAYAQLWEELEKRWPDP